MNNYHYITLRHSTCINIQYLFSFFVSTVDKPATKRLSPFSLVMKLHFDLCFSVFFIPFVIMARETNLFVLIRNATKELGSIMKCVKSKSSGVLVFWVSAFQIFVTKFPQSSGHTKDDVTKESPMTFWRLPAYKLKMLWKTLKLLIFSSNKLLTTSIVEFQKISKSFEEHLESFDWWTWKFFSENPQIRNSVINILKLLQKLT